MNSKVKTMNRNNDIAVDTHYQIWNFMNFYRIELNARECRENKEKMQSNCNFKNLSLIFVNVLLLLCRLFYWIIEMFIKILLNETKFHAYDESKSRRFYLSFWDINLWAFPCIWMNVIFMMPILTKRVCCNNMAKMLKQKCSK